MSDERPLLERLDAGAWPQAANMQEAAAYIRELLAQLPEGMKDCTIEFKECEYGHGRLVATNWVDHGCHFCRIRELEKLMWQKEREMLALEYKTKGLAEGTHVIVPVEPTREMVLAACREMVLAACREIDVYAVAETMPKAIRAMIRAAQEQADDQAE